jgi:excisionase family DNA binding protein
VRAPREDKAQLDELSTALRPSSTLKLHYELVDPSGKKHPIPESVIYGLARIAEVLARGDALAIVPIGAEVTTQQAADLLNVSRQYFVRLLDEKKIPFVRTGSHRRLRIEDVLAYKAKRDVERDAGLAELARLTEEYGGYEK